MAAESLACERGSGRLTSVRSINGNWFYPGNVYRKYGFHGSTAFSWAPFDGPFSSMDARMFGCCEHVIIIISQCTRFASGVRVCVCNFCVLYFVLYASVCLRICRSHVISLRRIFCCCSCWRNFQVFVWFNWAPRLPNCALISTSIISAFWLPREFSEQSYLPFLFSCSLKNATSRWYLRFGCLCGSMWRSPSPKIRMGIGIRWLRRSIEISGVTISDKAASLRYSYSAEWSQQQQQQQRVHDHYKWFAIIRAQHSLWLRAAVVRGCFIWLINLNCLCHGSRRQTCERME